MRRCKRCVLPESFPGVRLDEEGVCQYCRRFDAQRYRRRREQVRRRFEALAAEMADRPGFHAIVAWSGGKDSTYTLWLMKEKYHLRPLAFTFDNGFVAERAFRNMRLVSDRLGIDHIIVKPSFTLVRDAFRASLESDVYNPKALERASAICTTCIAFAKGIGIRMALERRVPLLVYGWSPGQVPISSALFHQTRPFLTASLQAMKEALARLAPGPVEAYFPTDEMLETAPMPWSVAPLAFLPYDEAEVRRLIGTLGWEAPQDTDPTSTNCLLNTFAIEDHRRRHGYHPYVMELAALVRQGHLSREEALARLDESLDPTLKLVVEAKLGF